MRLPNPLVNLQCRTDNSKAETPGGVGSSRIINELLPFEARDRIVHKDYPLFCYSLCQELFGYVTYYRSVCLIASCVLSILLISGTFPCLFLFSFSILSYMHPYRQIQEASLCVDRFAGRS